MEVYTGILVFVFGIILGSFLNVCILRLPEEKTIVNGNSACPSCGVRLTAIDLVPVFSYIFLRGKCRRCKSTISPQYIIIELLTGILFFFLYLKFGFTPPLPVLAALIAALIVIALIDWRYMMIPDGLIITILTIGVIETVITAITGLFGSWLQYVIGFLAGGLPLLLIALFCYYILKKEALGAGDIKLMAAAGLVIGWKLIITAYIIGIVFGALFGILLLVTKIKKREDAIPFGPFLSFGILASVFFGNEIINWYLGMM